MTERWRLMREHWHSLTLYQRFEGIVSFALTLIITVVIKETTSDQLLGMAAVTLALGITYWLVRERNVKAKIRNPNP